ncbi:hypothetical protein LUX05_06345 [Streptomyces somaliensis]|nr:hypothetical protein [Streptomyces somaliensis]
MGPPVTEPVVPPQGGHGPGLRRPAAVGVGGGEPGKQHLDALASGRASLPGQRGAP